MQQIRLSGNETVALFDFLAKTPSTPATPEKFESTTLRLGLPSPRIRHENGAFRKRSSNASNLKKAAHFAF